jgi:hypothetical protein
MRRASYLNSEIEPSELTCYCKGGAMNLDTLYQLMMMKPADCIPKIKSLS